MDLWFSNNLSPSLLPLVLAVSATSVVCTFLILRRFSSEDDDYKHKKQKSVDVTIPAWYQKLLESKEMKFLHVKEWENKNNVYRSENGWHGEDYMHSPSSHVRIFDYLLSSSHPNSSHETDIYLTSIVSFTSNAESHQGLCHGGTMCAVMDDIIGWTGFCESGQCIPWSGYTVQIDTSLKKPIPIGSVLKVEGWIEKREGQRKIHIKARLVDENGVEHAQARGLFLKK